ncbi:outer membrane protein assembly factor BamD [Porphyromonas macacae]|uniref:outer membrane protein assembly factor BamD n=1 Tax=Porphyromonas macacae TaxID=28115 RepID=UPI00359F31B2
MWHNKYSWVIASLMTLIFFTSCGEYYEVQKSTDLNRRYSYAKKCYNEKKYGRAIVLLEDIVPSLSSSEEGAQALYLLADSYFKDKRYMDASISFAQYAKRYPKDMLAEESRYNAAKSYYMLSPDARLDQSSTLDALKELRTYLEFYPEGKYAKDVEKMLFDLQDKLAYKEYLAAKLYYNLGPYMGNNYRSAVVTAKAAVKEYPYSKYRDDLEFLILQAKYQEATNSILSKMQTRFREVVDQYYNYINLFPEGKYLKQAKKIYEEISRQYVSDTNA